MSANSSEKKGVSRRIFIKGASGVLAGVMGVGFVGSLAGVGGTAFSIPDSNGYLLVDDTLCQNCKVCMSVCSLYNEGYVCNSLSRIQITDDPLFANHRINQCRHCVNAPCVEICPTKAVHAEPKVENARLIDEEKCLGCRLCNVACPFTLARMQYNVGKQKMRKCSLCDGEPQCAKHCPTKAVRFITGEVPIQQGDAGYRVDFRKEYLDKGYGWARTKHDQWRT